MTSFDMSSFALQSKIANSISTGNILVDFVMISMASTMIGSITRAITEGRVFSWLYDNYAWASMLCKRYYNRLYDYWNGTIKTIRREVVIEEINVTNKTVNYIYPAVYSFVTSLVDLNDEPRLVVSTDQTLALDERDKPIVKINREPGQFKPKEFEFEGYKLQFTLSQELVTIYGSEKERKKQNSRVTVAVEMKETDKRNVLQEFIEFCIVSHVNSQNSNKGKIKVFVNDKNGQWNNEKSSCLRSITSLVLKKGQKERIVADVTRFVKSEEWYISRDLDWKRGYLFYGLCGTGKTSLIKGLAKMTERNIYYLSLTNVTDDEQLRRLFNTVDFRKSVIVIEDIDATLAELHTREKDSKSESKDASPASSATSAVDALAMLAVSSLAKKSAWDDEEMGARAPAQRAKSTSNVTLAGVLNVLDGIFSSHGRLLFMTSNNPHILDKALLRSGRVDVKEHIGRCDAYQLCELVRNFHDLKELPQDYEERLHKLELYKWSPAEVSEILLSNMDDLPRAIHILETQIPELEELH
jgi:hypothetical protein